MDRRKIQEMNYAIGIGMIIVLLGSIWKFGNNQYKVGFNACVHEYSKSLEDKQKEEHKVAIDLENQLNELEDKYDLTTKRIIEVVESMPCDHVSAEFIELFNDLHTTEIR
jgi:hypothetical protein